MSFLDKIASAIMPPESVEDRVTARQNVQQLSSGNDWIAMALDHHQQIETAFQQAGSAADPAARRAAVLGLGAVLTAHSNAEESVLYPAMVESGHKGHATMAYEEQAMAKVQMAELEKLDPMSQEWTDKLEHIKGAVLHHIYQEEKDWFPEIAQQTPADRRELLTMRFRQEYDRYMAGVRDDSMAQPAI